MCFIFFYGAGMQLGVEEWLSLVREYPADKFLIILPPRIPDQKSGAGGFSSKI
jgi:hypothetical protein